MKYLKKLIIRILFRSCRNPIVLKSIIMGVLFHNYKVLLQVGKEDVKVNESLIKKEITLLAENCLEGKFLFD